MTFNLFNFILFVSSVLISTADNNIICPETWLKCIEPGSNSEKCISPLFICDGFIDCEHSADEMDCLLHDNTLNMTHPFGIINADCDQDHFPCESGICIPNEWVCNGEDDCLKGEDEMHCNDASNHSNIHYHCNGFHCKNGKCVLKMNRCDGSDDCGDNSDETDCHEDSLCQEDNGKFRCKSGFCLDLLKVCNGHDDCPDGDDEGHKCRYKECNSLNCSMECFQTPRGARCYCRQGYHLAKDFKTCIDIDECSVDHPCSHECINTIGGFNCTCEEGFHLVNETRCIAEDEDPLLITSFDKGLRAYGLETKRLFPIASTECRVTGMSLDPDQQNIYWTEVCRGRGFVYKQQLASDSSRREVIDTGLKTPQDVAIDYVTRNIYVTDLKLKKIIACKTDGSNCVTVVSDIIDKVHSITIDPENATMYWTDWGRKPGIYSALMDGSESHLFIGKDIEAPSGISLDRLSSRLYWCDIHLHTIEYYDFVTKLRSVVINEEAIAPISMAVFSDRIYWADKNFYQILSVNKNTGHELKDILRLHEGGGLGVHVSHHSMMPSKRRRNPCWAFECSHLCLLRPGNNYTCACPDHMELNESGRRCVSKNRPFLLVSNVDTIYAVNFGVVGQQSTMKVNSHSFLVGALAYNWRKKMIYAFDLATRDILSIDSNGYRETFIAKDHYRDYIGGMAYCDHTDNLYWVDSNNGYLEIARGDGKHSVVLKRDLERPVDIEIFFERNELFICSMGMKSSIMMLALDGSNPRVLLKARQNQLFTSLFLCKESSQLYWGDARNERIDFMQLAQGDELGHVQSVLKKGVSSVMSFAIHEEFIYWTSMQPRDLMYFNRHDSNSQRFVIPLPASDNSRVTKYVILAHEENSTSPCVEGNGGCSHICLYVNSQVECLCPTNHALEKDGRTCRNKTKSCEVGEILCPDFSSCYLVEWACDGTQDCADGSDEKNCTTQCHDGQFACSEGTSPQCIPESWVCDGKYECSDGFDEMNCTGCKINQFDCGQGKCIDKAWHCDGTVDCENGIDEKGCDLSCDNSTEFKCHDENCIPKSRVCDNYPDCVDGSDETDCLSFNCTVLGKKQCKSGSCVETSHWCDGTKDCGDGSDEVSCPNDEFRCSQQGLERCGDSKECYDLANKCDGFPDCTNGEDENDCSTVEKHCEVNHLSCGPHSQQCIKSLKVCDGERDCENGWDEETLQCKMQWEPESITPNQCSNGEFMCTIGECISLNKVCDNHQDCLDGSDESMQCHDTCSSNNGGCEQICNITPRGRICSCKDGFTLKDDHTHCEDIDECGTVGMCSHYCKNTIGSFECSCAEGYHLTQDKHHCKANNPEAYVVYMDNNEILTVALDDTKSKKITKLPLSYELIDLDVDFNSSRVLYLDRHTKTIDSVNFDGKEGRRLVSSIEFPNLFAWDYIGKNIYFVERMNEIKVCNEKSGNCSFLLKSTVNPIQSFAVHSSEGILFWCEWLGRRSSDVGGMISRANMDGSSKVHIIHGQNTPSGITFDIIGKKIYWVEASNGKLFYSSFDGTGMKPLANNHASSYSIVIFEDNVFWANNGSLFRCNKFTGKACVTMHTGEIPAKTIKLYHPVLQRPSINPCEKSNCSHLCVLKPNGFTCLCEDKHKLASDNRTCVHESILEPCKHHKCLNGGKCRPSTTDEKGWLCICINNFTGDICQDGPENLPSGSKSSDKQDDGDETDSSTLKTIFFSLLVMIILISLVFVVVLLAYRGYPLPLVNIIPRPDSLRYRFLKNPFTGKGKVGYNNLQSDATESMLKNDEQKQDNNGHNDEAGFSNPGFGVDTQAFINPGYGIDTQAFSGV